MGIAAGVHKSYTIGKSLPTQLLCRAFSPKEAADARLVVERVPRAGREGVWFRVGDRYFEDGYLLRHYNVRNLSLEEGVPPLEELQRFNQVPQAS